MRSLVQVRAGTALRRISRVGIVCLLALNVSTAVAQGVTSDTAQRLALRGCPRERCELALERGTLHGTQLRIGSSSPADSMVPVGFMGTRVIRHLSVMPEAAEEARQARRALQHRMLIAVVTLAGIATVASYGWQRPYADAYSRREYAAPAVSARIGIVTVVAASGIFFADRRARAAMRHLYQSVRLYNEQLPH